MAATKVSWFSYTPTFDRAPKIAPAKKPEIQATETAMRYAEARSPNPASYYFINVEDGRGVDGKAEAYIKKMYHSFKSAQE